MKERSSEPEVQLQDEVRSAFLRGAELVQKERERTFNAFPETLKKEILAYEEATGYSWDDPLESLKCGHTRALRQENSAGFNCY